MRAWEARLDFRDRRAPQEIQFGLERDMMSLFRPEWDGPVLVFKGQAKPAGLLYEIQLRFEAAHFFDNAYSLRASTSWAHLPPTNDDYFAKTSPSWFGFWTMGFKPAEPAASDEVGEGSRYKELAGEAIHAEDHLSDVPAIQREIVARMREGANFSTAHKEGGTTIRWSGSRFVLADYGESSGVQKFDDQAAFLIRLRQFYGGETSRTTHPEKPPEFDAWKLILRKLRKDG